MITCSLCDSKHYAKGYCRKHYMRLYTHGDPLFMLKPRNPGAVCWIPSCDRPHYGKGMCNPHWQRMRRGEQLERIEEGYEIRRVECQR